MSEPWSNGQTEGQINTLGLALKLFGVKGPTLATDNPLASTAVTRHLGVRIRNSVLEKDILPDKIIR